MFKNLIVIITVLILFISCTKQNEVQVQKSDYILFGHFYGFCVGEQCIEIFKLTNEELYEDDTDQYPSHEKPYEGNFIKLEDSRFELVKSLSEHIPEQLLMEQDTIIGMPDASDGGGVYFAVKGEDGTRFWLIDQFDHNIPEYLRPFKDEINNSISEIND